MMKRWQTCTLPGLTLALALLLASAGGALGQRPGAQRPGVIQPGAKQQGGGAARPKRAPGAGQTARRPQGQNFKVVPKNIEFEGKTWVADFAKEAEVVDYKGKKALHIVGGEATYVYLKEAGFTDGIIECDIAGATFSGLAFRGTAKGRKAEKLYFRPQNAGTAKKDNTVQYSQIGNPKGTWRYLRENFPGKYETSADIKRGEWFHAKLKIQGKKLEVFVNDGKKPVMTVDPMLGTSPKGTVGFWGYNTYYANFKFKPAQEPKKTGKK